MGIFDFLGGEKKNNKKVQSSVSKNINFNDCVWFGLNCAMLDINMLEQLIDESEFEYDFDEEKCKAIDFIIEKGYSLRCNRQSDDYSIDELYFERKEIIGGNNYGKN